MAMSGNEPAGEIGYFEARGVDPADYAGYRIPAWMRTALPPPDADPAILDVGCGYGATLEALAAEGYRRVQGIDVDSAAVAHCRGRGLDVTRVTGIREFLARAGRIDCVIMSHVLEHLPKPEVIPTLAALQDALSDDGCLLVMVPNAQANTGAYWAYEDFTHEMLFTSGSLAFVLRKAGFRDIRFYDVDCTADLGGWKRLVRRGLLALYRGNRRFWNRVTGSAYHAASPEIYSYEIKVSAK